MPDILTAFSGVKKSGSGWTAKCPAHEDHRASLSIGQGDDGRWLLKCHAGCDVDAILAEVHLEVRDLFPKTNASSQRAQIVAEYDYTDEQGVLLYQAVRFSPKDFRQRRPDGQGGWNWSVKGVRRVLYRLTALQGQKTVFIVEGERDANRLAELGLVATTNAGGAGKWRDEYTKQLTAAGVQQAVVIPDADEPGMTHARAVVASCHAAGIKTKLLTLPVATKGDVSDYLSDHGRADLIALVTAAPLYEPAPAHDTRAGSPSAPSGSDESPETTTLDCEALLVEHKLSNLDVALDRAVLEGRLRTLAMALRGADRLTVALVREALITELKAAKIRTATVIVDAALKVEQTTPENHQGAPLLLADVDPWPEPVDGSEVLDAVIRTITRFIVLPRHGAVALVLWILHTYLMDAWWLSPLAVASSPTRRCGKTALLTVVFELASRPLAASNISPAALFRAVEKYQPTLLLDEGETWLKANEELRGIVNAGHTRRTAMVIRTVGDDHEPAIFSTWCAKFIALIGDLPDTLMDRSLVIEMRRKTAEERVERLRLDQLPAICDPLRRQMARWAVDHATGLAAADPEIPTGLHDRAADNWRPLLALSEAVGGEWPSRARTAAQALAGVDQEDAIGVQLLWDIKEIFSDEEVLSSKAIIDALVALEDRPWATWSRQDKPMTGHALARLLRKFHIVPAGTVRVGDKTHKGYRRATFEDAWARYPLIEPSHGNEANEDGAETDFSECHNMIECDALKTAVEPMNTGVCDGVTVQNQGEAPQEENQPIGEEADDADDCARF